MINKLLIFTTICVSYLHLCGLAHASTNEGCEHFLGEKTKYSSLSYENQEVFTFICEQVEEQEGQVRPEKKYAFLVLFDNLYSNNEAKLKSRESARAKKNRLISLSRIRGQAFVRQLEKWIKKNALESELQLNKNLNKNIFLGFHLDATIKGAVRLVLAYENSELPKKFKPLILWKDLK